MDTISTLATSLQDNPLGVLALVVLGFIWLMAKLGTRILTLIERLSGRSRDS